MHVLCSITFFFFSKIVHFMRMWKNKMLHLLLHVGNLISPYLYTASALVVFLILACTNISFNFKY